MGNTTNKVKNRCTNQMDVYRIRHENSIRGLNKKSFVFDTMLSPIKNLYLENFHVKVNFEVVTNNFKTSKFKNGTKYDFHYTWKLNSFKLFLSKS